MMTDMFAEDHDFNWVEALDKCSPACQFALMREDVGKLTAMRQSKCMGDPVKLEFYGGDEVFEVRRVPVCGNLGKSNRIAFRLHRDTIRIEGNGLKDSIVVTLTVNDDGDCCFKIDNEGCYRRWQVTRKALEPMFYPYRTSSR